MLSIGIQLSVDDFALAFKRYLEHSLISFMISLVKLVF
jgi:hypothetical protein